MAIELSIHAEAPAQHDAARELAAGFGLSVDPSPACPQLRLDESGLSLLTGNGSSIRVDFVGGRMGYRRHHSIGRRQPLARALGLAKGLTDLVDATAGMGRDAFVLAACGASVRMLERSAVVCALLADGLRRAHSTEATAAIAARMTLARADAADWLAGLAPQDAPEAVYLDPMYPHSGKSAQVKKEMQALRELLGPDTDSERVLDAALAVSRRRVVVKRPRGAEHLAGRRPDFCIDSPNTRYDVYLCG